MNKPSKVEIFEDQVRRIISNNSLRKDNEFYKLIVENEEQLTAFLVKIKEYGMDYCVRASYLNRSRKGYRLLWRMQDVEYNKTPFIIRNVIEKQCIVGPHYYKKSKQEMHDDHPAGRKKRFQMQPTKKSGCPATMKIVHITTYPQYSGKNSRRSRTKAFEELKMKLENADEDLVKEDKWFITLSNVSGHSHSTWSCFLNQGLDERLKKEIECLLSEGITNIRTGVLSSDLLPVINSESVNLSRDGTPDDLSVPPSEDLNDSSQKSHSDLRTIRELIKSLYDSSFLMSSEFCSDDRNRTILIEKLRDSCDLMKHFMRMEPDIAIAILPSELPERRKSKTKNVQESSTLELPSELPTRRKNKNVNSTSEFSQLHYKRNRKNISKKAADDDVILPSEFPDNDLHNYV